MKEKSIADLIEEAVDKMAELNTPYAIICSRKTFEKISVFFTALGPFEERHVCKKMVFTCEFGDLPILKFKFCPEDRIHVVDKDTYERLMKEEKRIKNLFDKYPCELLKSQKKEPRKLKTATYNRRGLKFDLGKKAIIKRIG